MLRNVVFIFLFLIIVVKPDDKYVIIGAGPVGLYLSYELLETNPNSKVTIFEGRPFTRLQCIRLPFAIAKKFPLEVKRVLWPVDTLREMIFKNQYKLDPNLFWPVLGYHHFPRISVGNLQQTFKNYLVNKYNSRFEYKTETARNDIIQSSEYKIIFITAGYSDITKDTRRRLQIDIMKYDFLNAPLDGVYLIYKNVIDGVTPEKINEDYKRNGSYMNRIDLSNNGLTYSATNNGPRDVQLYTYPVNSLIQFYESMPESLKTTASFPKGLNYKLGRTLAENEGKELSEEMKKENRWLEQLRPVLDDLFNRFGIYIPEHAKLHYAKRLQYAFKHTHGYNEHNVPVVYLGDAMGGTDYKYGLNLGRGLYCADNLVSFLLQTPANIPEALNNYQDYWNKVLEKEFGSPEKDLIADSEIFYKYAIMGRNIDDKIFGEKDFKSFLNSLVRVSEKKFKKIKKKIK
jgi:hypothetical protein